MPHGPVPGTLGNGGCDTNYRRRGPGCNDAALDMAAKRRGPARLDRAHDAALSSAKMTDARLTIRLAVAMEDVRHLQCGHGRIGSGRRGALELEPVERAGRVADCRGSDLGIAGCGRQVAMTEERLDLADVGAGLERMGGEAVAERMDGDRLATNRWDCASGGGGAADAVVSDGRRRSMSARI
jgi:hypothetical protein